MTLDILVGIVVSVIFFLGLLYVNYKDDICNDDCNQGRCCECRCSKEDSDK